MAVKSENTQDIALSDDRACRASPQAAALADRLISLVTALAVATVAAIAAVISHRHAYELVSANGEAGAIARELGMDRRRVKRLLDNAAWRRPPPQSLDAVAGPGACSGV